MAADTDTFRVATNAQVLPHAQNINFSGSITIERELAQLGPTGNRPLRRVADGTG